MGWPLAAAYLLLLVALEAKLLRASCVHCAYFGKACFCGKGAISGKLFRRADPPRFSVREVSWLSLLPDLLVVFIPLCVGLFLLFRQFDGGLLLLMAALVLLAFPGNGFVRSQLACAHCRQRELGCPAEKLFNKRAK